MTTLSTTLSVDVLSHKPDCLRWNSLARCTCDDELLSLDDSEDSPLIALQNYSEGADVECDTDIHCQCHEAEPSHSNSKARRKLAVASIVCLFFVIGELIGIAKSSPKRELKDSLGAEGCSLDSLRAELEALDVEEEILRRKTEEAQLKEKIAAKRKAIQELSQPPQQEDQSSFLTSRNLPRLPSDNPGQKTSLDDLFSSAAIGMVPSLSAAAWLHICVDVLSHKPDCLRWNSLARCTCDDELLSLDDSEDSPLIALQNYSEGADDVECDTDIHCQCHEAEPSHSNSKARRKLAVASIVCLFFVIAELIGKSN
ncbi:hypothetical protein ACROYT_G026512 [Oculina patagonica]